MFPESRNDVGVFLSLEVRRFTTRKLFRCISIVGVDKQIDINSNH